MKSLAVTVILLIVMIACIVWNYFYINQTADEMNKILEAIPDITSPNCEQKAHQITEYWQSRTDMVGLSVGYSALDRISEQCKLLLSSIHCGDSYGYHEAITLLRDAIEDMRRLEQFSVSNLL